MKWQARLKQQLMITMEASTSYIELFVYCLVDSELGLCIGVMVKAEGCVFDEDERKQIGQEHRCHASVTG